MAVGLPELCDNRTLEAKCTNIINSCFQIHFRFQYYLMLHVQFMFSGNKNNVKSGRT